MTDPQTPGTPEPTEPAQQPPPPPPPPPAAGDGGLDPKIGGLLAYLLFGWIGGLIMFLTQKHPEVRFHGAQSILVFGPLHVLSLVLGFLGGAGFGFGMGFGMGGFFLFALVALLVNLLAFVLWIYLSIQGYSLNHVKMPIVGDMAEQWAAK
jgi:uncharacterized membrane protein